MNKPQRCARVADAAVGAVFAAIADALARDEPVTIAGFGKFAVRPRPA